MGNVVCCAKLMSLPVGGGARVSGNPDGLGLALTTLFTTADPLYHKPARFCHSVPIRRDLIPRTEFLTRLSLPPSRSGCHLFNN